MVWFFFNFYNIESESYLGDLVPSKAQIFLDCLVVPKDYGTYEVLKIPEINISAPPSQQQRFLNNAENLISKFCYFWNKLFIIKINLKLSGQNQQYENNEIIELKSGQVPSPFPELDDYMLSVFQSLNADARIRLWRIIITKFNKSRLVQYQVFLLIWII